MSQSSVLAQHRFSGRSAIVTGAVGGIGRAIATRLASEGATVFLVDLDPSVDELAAAMREDGLAVEAAQMDITDQVSCQRLAHQVLDHCGAIDVLVNNAGINRRGALLDLTVEDWDATLDVNLNAMFHLTRALLPSMVSARSGAIVNTASQWGLYPAPGHIAYNVSKAAVVSFTRATARDYAPHGVRVNAVCPGEIHTPMVEAALARTGRTIADLDALVPFGRIGRPEEVAALVAFLASDEAPFICGAVVEITGAQAVA